jgi:hypothetical protein
VKVNLKCNLTLERVKSALNVIFTKCPKLRKLKLICLKKHVDFKLLSALKILILFFFIMNVISRRSFYYFSISASYFSVETHLKIAQNTDWKAMIKTKLLLMKILSSYMRERKRISIWWCWWWTQWDQAICLTNHPTNNWSLWLDLTKIREVKFHKKKGFHRISHSFFFSSQFSTLS